MLHTYLDLLFILFVFLHILCKRTYLAFASNFISVEFSDLSRAALFLFFLRRLVSQPHILFVSAMHERVQQADSPPAVLARRVTASA